MKKRIVIIGAGFGGLAVANLLAKSGYAVDIYEANSMPGGRAGELKVDGFRFDTGPSWFLMPDVYEHYFNLLDYTTEDLITLERLDPAYKVFFEHDTPIAIGSNLEQNSQTFDAIEPGAGKSLRRYLAESEKIYNLSIDNFLYDNLSIKDILTPKSISLLPRLVPALAISIDRYVRTYFHDRRLRQIMEYPMVFLGSSPFTAPSMYRLMSHLDFTQGVYFPKGGMYELVKALTKIGETLGVNYHYDAPVNKILTENKRTCGIELANGQKVDADIVISNADLHYTETTLVPENLQTYPASYWQKKEAAPSAILLYLGVKGKLPQLTHHNLFFIDDWEANFTSIYSKHAWPTPASIYVSKTSATDPTTAPNGYENIFVLVPGPSGESNNTHIETLVESYITQLAAMSGIHDLKQRIVAQKIYRPSDFGTDFHSWKNSALGLSHLVRQSAFMRPANISRKISDLYYVGASTTPGIGLPMCLIGAELVYKRIVGEPVKGRLKRIRPE